MLPTDPTARKAIPIATGVLDYFPKALAAIAEVSRAGNEQHNPGSALHWDRSKSTDEADALIRHFLERGKLDSDGLRHSAKTAWRALALLEKELEAGTTQLPLAKTIAAIEADGDTHMAPMFDETGKPWGGASPKKAVLKPGTGWQFPPPICTDCGADLDETGHFASCLSQAARIQR